jgi:hypothetical protein
MLILLTQHKHNRPAAVNPDHIVWIDTAAEERANVYLSNGTLLQVKETVAQVARMTSQTLTVDTIQTGWAEEATAASLVPADKPRVTDEVPEQRPEPFPADVTGKPGKNRETK